MYHRRVWFIGILFMLLAGCQRAGALEPTADNARAATLQAEIVQMTIQAGPLALTPLQTPTPEGTPDPFSGATNTPLPSPTFTPRAHTVAAGEDMGGIAFQYGITVPTLMAANPEVNPFAMSIGTVLMIPPPTGGEGSSDNPLQPTPIPVSIGPAHCYSTASGGLWCFAVAFNTQDLAVESVSARFRVIDSEGENLAQVAPALLDTLPEGGELPLGAYFEGPIAPGFQAGAELASALPLANPGERYLTVQVSQPQVEISASGLSAFVRGTLTVEGERPAGSLRLLAGAFDGENRPVGLRLWEIRPQSASPTSEFELTVYSAGGTIDRVEVWAEARP